MIKFSKVNAKKKIEIDKLELPKPLNRQFKRVPFV